MTHRSICLPAAEMEGKSAPQTPARRTNEHESSLNDALAVRGSIRAATPSNINKALVQVVDNEPKPAPVFEPGGPTDTNQSSSEEPLHWAKVALESRGFRQPERS